MSFKIYGLYEPDTNDIKYVGKTITSLKQRLNNHIYKAKSGRSKSPVSQWILGLVCNNKKPVIKLIQEYDDTYDWSHCEIKWISFYRKSGTILLNKAEGGGGLHKNIDISQEVIDMMGKISDTEIAEKTGISRRTISNRRMSLGIQKCSNSKYRYRSHNMGKPAHNRHIFSQEIIDMMGKISDVKVAEIAGVGRKTVERFRKRNNISKYVARGEKHHMAKLSKKDVEDIMRLKGTFSLKELAKKYNVGYYTIRDILSGKSWKND